MDPITLEPITKPCLTEAGSLYDRNSIILWLKKNNTDPLTRTGLKTRTLLPLNPIDLKIFSQTDFRKIVKKFWVKFWRSISFKQDPTFVQSTTGISEQTYDSIRFSGTELVGKKARFRNCHFESCLFSVKDCVFDQCKLDQVQCQFTCSVVLRLLLDPSNQVKNVNPPGLWEGIKTRFAIDHGRWNYFQHYPTPSWCLSYSHKKSLFEKLVLESSRIEHCSKCLDEYQQTDQFKDFIIKMYLAKSCPIQLE